jgi:RNA polymerase sigma-70 factor (ECF subfamily)
MDRQTDDDTTDERLAIRCQLGDQEAWGELVARWNPRLARFLNRMINDSDVVEDMTQLIWLKIVRSISQLKDPGLLAAWIYRIARIAVTDRLRKHYGSPVSVHDETEPESQDLAMEQFIESDQITNAMQKLHPQDREVIVLHYFEHLSVAEVAGVCGVPIGTTKSRMNRARSFLRRILDSGDQS